VTLAFYGSVQLHNYFMALSEVGSIVTVQNYFTAQSDVGLLWVSMTGRDYFMALSEVGSVMGQYDSTKLLYGPE
jgi:hypothetical protein